MTNHTEREIFNRPIGFWIKVADDTLTARINALHRDLGLGRRDWQLLNTLVAAGGTLTRRELLKTFEPMVRAPELQDRLRDLEGKGWITVCDPAVELTDDGRGLHLMAAGRQDRFRKMAVRGISDEDYRTTLRVLAQIVENCRAGSG